MSSTVALILSLSKDEGGAPPSNEKGPERCLAFRAPMDLLI